jgi:hypothetical protein
MPRKDRSKKRLSRPYIKSTVRRSPDPGPGAVFQFRRTSCSRRSHFLHDKSLVVCVSVVVGAADGASTTHD